MYVIQTFYNNEELTHNKSLLKYYDTYIVVLQCLHFYISMPIVGSRGWCIRVLVVVVISRFVHLLNRRRVDNSHWHHRIFWKATLHLPVLLTQGTPVQAAVHQARVTWRVLQPTTQISKLWFTEYLLMDWLEHWENKRTTLRWYFFCKDCRTRPVYTPHIHHANNRPSQIRNEVLGSTPWKIAVPAATAMPPSTKTAWQMHGVVHGTSSLKFSILRPNWTQGQNSPVKPVKVKNDTAFNLT